MASITSMMFLQHLLPSVLGGAAPAAAAAIDPAAATAANHAPNGGGLASEAISIQGSVNRVVDAVWESMGMDPKVMRERAEEISEREQKRAELTEAEGGKAAASKMIAAEYLKDAPTINLNQGLGDLGGANDDNKAERLKALSSLVQTDPDSETSQHLCGPTTLIAAAVYGKGEDGLKDLMDILEADQKDSGKPNRAMTKELAALRKKLAAPDGEVNQADIQMLQSYLYADLRNRHEALGIDDEDHDGVHQSAMEDFINGNEAMKKMFQANGMAVNYVDNDGLKGADGSLSADHYTLAINDKDRGQVGSAPFNTIYDPYARRGGQVVTAHDQIKDYDFAQRTLLQVR